MFILGVTSFGNLDCKFAYSGFTRLEFERTLKQSYNRLLRIEFVR